MEEVFFAFELVAHVADFAAVVVWFGADAEEGEFIGWSGDSRVKIWESDSGVGLDILEDLSHDLVSPFDFLGGWLHAV